MLTVVSVALTAVCLVLRDLQVSTTPELKAMLHRITACANLRTLQTSHIRTPRSGALRRVQSPTAQPPAPPAVAGTASGGTVQGATMTQTTRQPAATGLPTL
jgi:hypothetical protein